MRVTKAEGFSDPKRDTQRDSVVVGVKGVRLKHFEHALVKLLPHVEPLYLSLDKLPLQAPDFYGSVSALNNWEELPSAARIHGTLLGQISDKQKASRKEGQIKSLLKCIFAILPTQAKEKDNRGDYDEPLTIVDFGGGSGHLSIPLAMLLPSCRIICLDLKQKSLDFLHDKARKCRGEMGELSPQDTAPKQADCCADSNSRLKPTAIPNLFAYSGDIESYSEPFQIGVALHVCGEATDIVLRKCAQSKAHIVATPCCVGKLNRQKKNPYIYQATAQNVPTVQYPQSNIFRQCLQCSDNQNGGNDTETTARYWDALAKAADYNHQLDMNDCNNAARRSAKGLLELDRQFYLQEAFPYRTVLTRMEPLTASPKNDILLGYYHDCLNRTCEMDQRLARIFNSSELHSDQVVIWTKEHLFSSASGTRWADGASNSHALSKNEDREQTNSVDWDWKEEEQVRNQITTFFDLSESKRDAPNSMTPTVTATDNQGRDARAKISEEKGIAEPKTLIFPTGLNRRKRKLIHFVAEQMGLAHWCLGKKCSEKTVAVRRKYTLPILGDNT